MSTLEVNKITPQGVATEVTLGDSGDTFTVPTGVGVTVTDEVKTNKISPASGTSFTMGDSGDTFTIPSGVTLDGSSATLTGFGTATVNGITMMDTWVLTSGFTINSYNPITANLAQFNAKNIGHIGTGMSESSGVFTFPSTGIYRVDANAYIFRNSGYQPYISLTIEVSTDGGSSFNTASVSYTNIPDSGNTHAFNRNTHIVDVTDTSNIKVRFAYVAQSGGISGTGSGTNELVTHFMFMRLGDT